MASEAVMEAPAVPAPAVMPWELQEFPGRNGNKVLCKVYPSGMSVHATPEEATVGRAVAALKARIAELEAAAVDRKGRR